MAIRLSPRLAESLQRIADAEETRPCVVARRLIALGLQREARADAEREHEEPVAP